MTERISLGDLPYGGPWTSFVHSGPGLDEYSITVSNRYDSVDVRIRATMPLLAEDLKALIEEATQEGIEQLLVKTEAQLMTEAIREPKTGTTPGITTDLLNQTAGALGPALSSSFFARSPLLDRIKK